MKWIVLAVLFFYNTIRSWIEQQIKNLGIQLGISVDVVIALLGYFIAKKGGWLGELGEGLLYGAIASLGRSGGLLVAGTQTQTATQTVSPFVSVMPFQTARRIW